MNQQRSMSCMTAILILSIAASVHAQPYTVLIGDIPGIDSLLSMTKTLGEDMNVKLDIKKVPIQRMVNMIIDKEADFGAPMLRIKDPNIVKNLPFDYSTGVIQQMCFILYTNKSRPVDIADLKKGNGKNFKIESDIANAQMFPFKTMPSTNPAASLQKVNDGLIDGYIMGVAPADDILRANIGKLKNIRRQLWDIYDIGYVLPKGAKGGAIDKFITDGLKKMNSSGKLKKILADVIKSGVYDDWQP